MLGNTDVSNNDLTEVLNAQQVAVNEGSPLLNASQGDPEDKRLILKESDIWFRIAASYILGAISSDPLGAFPAFLPLFERQGIFRQLCNDGEDSCDAQSAAIGLIFIVINSLAAVGSYPVGAIYDRIGAAWTGLYGSIGVGIGMVIAGIGMFGPSSLNYLLYLGFSMTMLAGTMTNFACFAFVWYVPTRQGTVIGLANSCYSLGGLVGVFMVYFAKKIMTSTSLFPYIFIVYGVLQIVIAPVYLWIVPSHEQVLAEAAHVLGAPMPPVQGMLASLKRTWQLIFKPHLRVMTSFCVWMLFVYIGVVTLWGSADVWWTDLLHSENQGEYLGELLSTAMAIFGAVFGPFMGRLVDYFGIYGYLVSSCVALTGWGLLMYIPSYYVQLGNVLIFATAMPLILVAITQVFQLFSGGSGYPELFGNSFGIALGGIGVFTIVLSGIFDYIFESMKMSTYRNLYWTLIICIGAYTLSGFWFLYEVKKDPFPEVLVSDKTETE